MISRNKNLIYILVTTFILLNLASLVWLRYDNGNWLFDTQDYERNKHNTYKRFKEHNFPHPFIGYSRTTFDGTYDSKFGEKLFWDVYQTENFTNKDPTILILGGSVAMHLSNNASDRDRNYRFGKNAFANVLKRIYPNSNFRVLNAAYGGNKQPQQYLTAVYLDLLGVNYDLVLNLDGFNEISLSLAENLVQKNTSYLSSFLLQNDKGLYKCRMFVQKISTK